MKTLSQKCSNLVLVGIVLLWITTSCNNSADPQLNAVIYSGTGNFSFSGDTTFNFQGTVDNVGIIPINDTEFLPLFLKNNDDLTLQIGINGDPKLHTGTYMAGVSPVQAFTSITLFGELYEATTGTVTITSLNENEIKGTVDTTITAFFSASNDIFIQGSFELTAN